MWCLASDEADRWTKSGDDKIGKKWERSDEKKSDLWMENVRFAQAADVYVRNMTFFRFYLTFLCVI